MNALNDVRSAAGFVGRRIHELLRTRGIAGSLVHLAVLAPALPRRILGIFREAAYDRTTGLTTSGAVMATSLGIDPGNLPGVATDAHGNAYKPTPAWAVSAMLRELDIAFPDYTFIDLGSGMGRAVLMAAEHPFAKVVGVEFSRDLHRVAQENLARRQASLRAGAVELLCQDARLYAFPPGNAVVYMFNPFREEVMTVVLKNLLAAFERPGADLLVVYFNPLLARLLDNIPRLTHVKVTRQYCIYRLLPRTQSVPGFSVS